MPAPHDLDPDAMTEEERLAKRRFEAGFAFETMPDPDTLWRHDRWLQPWPIPRKKCADGKWR